MNLVFIFSGLLVLLSAVYKSDAQKPDSIQKKCYKAKICVHNNHEKCGMDGNKEIRRFLDSCDIEEFNCLYDKDYKKMSMDACRDLPSLYSNEGNATDDVGDQPIQNLPDKLEDENNSNKLNLGHNSIEFDFSMPEEPQKHGLRENKELTDGVMKMIGKNATNTLRGTMIFNKSSIHGKKIKKPTNVTKVPVKRAKLVKYKTTIEDKTLRQKKE